jgi:hypothetical protein
MHLGSIRFFEEYFSSGDELGMVVNVLNHDGKQLDNVKIMVYSPELDYYYSSGSFDVPKHGVYSRVIYDEVPQVKGEYLVKIVVRNDDFKESAYRYITIV